MTTLMLAESLALASVVEVYRLDRYDNSLSVLDCEPVFVVEVYRLDRYDNSC